jgi:UDP-N-acetylmuramoylalanine--D-glutamate ligase
VDYFNDSKATNVDSTMKALEAFKGSLIVILGGRDKGCGYEPLRPLVAERAKHVLLLGEAGPKIARALEGAAPMTYVATMAEAVGRAHEMAEPGDTVLLAPACASFDMFDNYEHRGEVFKDEVRKLSLVAVNSRLNLHIEEAEPASSNK